MAKRIVKRKLRTPLIYYGGKTLIADEVIGQFPPHKVFVDVFGGGAAVTIAKPPSDVEVYNDIGFVSVFFKQLRDNGDKLAEMLKYTLWSRQEFEEDFENFHDVTDDLEKCRMWFTMINQAFTHQENHNTWLMSKGVNTAIAWRNHVDDLPYIVERFRNIIIEHMSFEYVIKQYDSKDTLFYCDPPYMPNAHSDKGKGYIAEMPEEKHRELLNMLHGVSGQVVVSGYSSPLYDDELKRWRIKRLAPRKGQIANSVGTRRDRTEVIWIKEHAHGLWQEDESLWPHSHVPAVQTNELREPWTSAAD